MTTISDAVRAAIQYQLANIHTVMLATFTSFDSSDCSASVKPSINKNYMDGTTNNPPVIHKVPVLFPVAGSASITFPINPGDHCLLVFCERSTEEWKRLGINEKPLDRRKFDLSDAIAIPGVLPFTSSMPPVGDDLTLRFGDSEIRIAENGDINIISQGTIRLNGSKIAIGNSFIPGGELLSIVEDILLILSTSLTTVLGAPIQPGLLVDPTINYGALLLRLQAIKGTL